MLQTLRNAWKIPDLRKKILYTLLALICVAVSANAKIQFLISPGGNIPKSSLKSPEPPPSSATVTIAVILDV